jgi:hypothetical protein
LVGSFGPEVGLLLDSAAQGKAFTLAGSEALDAQAVMYALADEPLIGEEIFAAPAYLQGTPMQLGSLRTRISALGAGRCIVDWRSAETALRIIWDDASMRSPVAASIAIGIGLIVLLGYFIQIPLLQHLQAC